MAEKDFKPGNRKYLSTVGRRKTSTAQVRVYPKGKGVFMINEIPASEYLQSERLEERAFAPLAQQNALDSYDITVLVQGGGKVGQADAIRLGIARALVEQDETLRTQLKKLGFLRRDARVKERKKYGLRKARRAPQWSKR